MRLDDPGGETRTAVGCVVTPVPSSLFPKVLDMRSEPIRYLVTGGRGFIGRHVVRRLIARGADVHATSRTQPREQADVRWWCVDLADAKATHTVMQAVRPDVVIHLASRAEGARSLSLVVPMLNDNVVTAVNVMAAAADVPGCRVVLAGSLEEHSDLEPGSGARSPYSASKIAATTYATLFRDIAQLPVVVLRLAMVYGPDDPHTTRLVPYVVDSFLHGAAPALSSGARRIDWVYVDDVVDALLAAAVEPAALGRVLDIGTGDLASIRDAVSLIAAVTGTQVVPEFGQLPDRPGDRDLVADAEPALRYLGWSARTSLRAGIERTVEWHARHLSRPAVSA
ncbi:NAD-dependent epimerase/dehydratase family protein [Pseudonocardia cypriaca]|uniref:UDP-glucose 4-epimerase n=1 Tax=Pseudonocardia cypriaca TaxID=882449 RepID=A0A543FW12_9PSEU|nr:NAD(P)-dependent oxidoreductase [Pseudonocardia cypriaca]TQM38025.1 UDP-glucose 4-epimerase [Pseudonocardia cypriaca]